MADSGDPTGGFTDVDPTGGFSDAPPVAPAAAPASDTGGFSDKSPQASGGLDQWLNSDNGVSDRGAILPIGRDKATGKLEWAVPEMVRSVGRGIEAFAHPDEAANNPQTEQDVVNAGMFFTPAGPEADTMAAARAARSAPKGAPAAAKGPSYAPKPEAPIDPTGGFTDVPPVAKPIAPGPRGKPKVQADVTDIDENGNVVKSGLPAIRPSPRPEPTPAEAAPTPAPPIEQGPPSPPSRLRVARQLPSGEIIEGQPNEIHAELYTPEELKSLEPGQYERETGFVTPDGKFLNRDSAVGWVAKNQPGVIEKMDEINKSRGRSRVDYGSGVIMEPYRLASDIMAEEGGFRTTPAQIANEHAAEVSRLEAEGAQAAANNIAPPPEIPGPAGELGNEGAPPSEPPIGGEGGGEEFVPKQDASGSLFQWIRGQEDELTKVRGENEADRTEALQYINGLPPELKDPELNERIYHNIEQPGTAPMTPEEQAMADKYVTPIRTEANEIYNRLRAKGVQIGMDGYVHRIAKDHGSMYDPQEGPPGANPFSGGRGLGQTTSSLKGRKMWMAVGPDGEQTLVNGKYKPGQKITDENGRQAIIRQATTKEIEEGSDVRYYKNAIANSIDNLLRLRRVERNINYLDGLKQDPTFSSLAKSPNGTRGIGDNGGPPLDDDVIPPGWKTTSLPQLRGWFMEPRIARMLDNFYEVGPQTDLGKVLAKVNHGLTSAIFVNPVSALFGHGLNVATHWGVGRGWDNFLPHTWYNSAKNGIRAMQDVTNLSPSYQRMLREGNSLMYAPTMNRDFHQTMIKLMGGEMNKQPQTWGEIAGKAGTSPAYIYKALSNLSSKGLWWANDVFMLQRVYDLMDKGHGISSAITEAEHEIPNYRIPSEAWDPDKMRGGAAFSELMANPNLTIFGRYRYGLIHAYANTVGRIVGKDVAPSQRMEAAGQLLALGVLFGVLYPAGDKVAQALTGNKHASLRRAGPTTVLAAVKGMMSGAPKGDTGDDLKNLMTGVSGLIGPAPGSEALAEAATNMDFFTGKRIYNPNDPKNIPGQLGYFAASRPFPLQQGEELAEGRKNRDEIIASWLGINNPSQKEFALRKHYAMKDYQADKKAWANKERALMRGLKKTYHNIFGFGGE